MPENFTIVPAEKLNKQQRQEFLQMQEEFINSQPVGIMHHLEQPSSGGNAFIAFHKGKMAGYARYQQEGDFLGFKALFVKPPYRNTGLARALGSHTIKIVLEQSAIKSTIVDWRRSKNLKLVQHTLPRPKKMAGRK